MKAVLLALVLGGCAGGQVVSPGKPYAVPVMTHCNPPVITEPDWNVNKLHPPVGIFSGTQAVVADVPLHQGYEAELRAALEACRSPSEPSLP